MGPGFASINACSELAVCNSANGSLPSWLGGQFAEGSSKQIANGDICGVLNACFPSGVNERAWNPTLNATEVGQAISPSRNHWLDQWQALSSGTLSPDAATVLSHAQVLSLDLRPKPGAGLEIDCSGTAEDCSGDGAVDGFGASGVPQGWASYIGAYKGGSTTEKPEAPGAGILRTAFPFPAREAQPVSEEAASTGPDSGAFSAAASGVPLTLLMALLTCLAIV